MRAIRVVALGIAALLLASPGDAQSNPLVGKWNIDYEAGRRMQNGESQVIMGKAVLEISAKGDSLIGTLQVEPQPGSTAAPPQRLTGKNSGNSATMLSTFNATVNRNGEQQTVSVNVTWELKAEGDALSGTSARAMANMPAAVTAPAPLKGTRVK